MRHPALQSLKIFRLIGVAFAGQNDVGRRQLIAEIFIFALAGLAELAGIQ